MLIFNPLTRSQRHTFRQTHANVDLICAILCSRPGSSQWSQFTQEAYSQFRGSRMSNKVRAHAFLTLGKSSPGEIRINKGRKMKFFIPFHGTQDNESTQQKCNYNSMCSIEMGDFCLGRSAIKMILL